MCAVSAIYNYYHNKPLHDWSWTVYIDYAKLVEAMKEYDKQTGQPDCEKPEVAEHSKVIEQYLTENAGPKPEEIK